jgi:hypothetical protein
VYHLLGKSKDRYYDSFMHDWTKYYTPKLKELDSPQKIFNACWIEPERLLNSRSERIYLFPCIPDTSTISFKNFQAKGGFLVSAEIINGKVAYVEISSRRDIDCVMVNPWKNSKVKVIRKSDGKPISFVYDTFPNQGIIFKTTKGESYLISHI